MEIGGGREGKQVLTGKKRSGELIETSFTHTANSLQTFLTRASTYFDTIIIACSVMEETTHCVTLAGAVMFSAKTCFVNVIVVFKVHPSEAVMGDKSINMFWLLDFYKSVICPAHCKTINKTASLSQKLHHLLLARKEPQTEGKNRHKRKLTPRRLLSQRVSMHVT